MLNLLLVAGGGALGSAARYLLGVQALRAFGPGWPYGTFAANLIGGFLMGVLVSVLAHRGGADQERLRLILGVGVLGGFTTFSAYSLEVARMLETKAYAQAAAYGSASVILAVVALFAGMMLTRWVLA
jgi:CrcB protein